METNKDQDTGSAETNNDNELESLESQTTVVEENQATGGATVTDAAAEPANTAKSSKNRNSGLKGLASRFNIYLLLFVLVLVIAGVVTAISVIRSRQVNETNQLQIATEPLSEEALEQLRQTDVKVGDPKQILTVESNAIFAGRVLIRGGLEVAGELKTGSPLNLPGITVTGSGIFNQIEANRLQVSGDSTLQGQLSVQNNLTVAGSGSFGGPLTASTLNIQNLQVGGNLQFTGHIDAGGPTPGVGGGPALGGGGTSSVSGTDTAGTVAINTGGGARAGCFATVNFTRGFGSTPHVVVTPVGSAAGGLNYYINRSANSFSICTASNPPSRASFAFDYVVIN